MSFGKAVAAAAVFFFGGVIAGCPVRKSVSIVPRSPDIPQAQVWSWQTSDDRSESVMTPQRDSRSFETRREPKVEVRVASRVDDRVLVQAVAVAVEAIVALLPPVPMPVESRDETEARLQREIECRCVVLKTQHAELERLRRQVQDLVDDKTVLVRERAETESRRRGMLVGALVGSFALGFLVWALTTYYCRRSLTGRFVGGLVEMNQQRWAEEEVRLEQAAMLREAKPWAQPRRLEGDGRP